MKRNDENFATEVTVGISLPYLTYLPDDYSDDGDGHPLLYFLHGAGERGSDLTALTKIALPKRLEEDLNLPFVVVCPQCPIGSSWNTVETKALLEASIDRYNIDRSRVYLSGLSMGGRGTWQLADVAGDLLAAVIAVCPPFVRVNPDNFKQLPVWCFHGVMDSVIPIADSVRMVRILRAAGGEVRFTTYADADHDSWTETYDNPEIYEWLLSHRKSP